MASASVSSFDAEPPALKPSPQMYLPLGLWDTVNDAIAAVLDQAEARP
jgi:hypothetical protein